jgi:hypothetical protein
MGRNPTYGFHPIASEQIPDYVRGVKPIRGENNGAIDVPTETVIPGLDFSLRSSIYRPAHGFGTEAGGGFFSDASLDGLYNALFGRDSAGDRFCPVSIHPSVEAPRSRFFKKAGNTQWTRGVLMGKPMLDF